MDHPGPRIASPIFVGVLIVMAAAVVLTVYHCIVMTWFNPRRSAHRSQRYRTERGPASSMETSIVRLVPPAYIYGKDEGLVAGDESTCAVCLSEFKDGEAVRVMPECSHCFHVPCIDMWLRSHISCPMCRSVAAPPHYQLHRGGELPPDPHADAAGFDRLTIQ